MDFKLGEMVKTISSNFVIRYYNGLTDKKELEFKSYPMDGYQWRLFINDEFGSIIRGEVIDIDIFHGVIVEVESIEKFDKVKVNIDSALLEIDKEYYRDRKINSILSE